MSDDFDLSDFGTFDEPSFPSEDMGGELPDIPEPPRGSGGRNLTFMAGLVVGIIIFVLAMCAIAYLIYQGSQNQVAYNATSTVIASTNQAVGTAIALTSTAKSWTATPTDTPTFTPTDTWTPSNTPTITPTFTPSNTPTPTIDITGTWIASMTEGALSAAQLAGSQTAAAQTQTQDAMSTQIAAMTMTALVGTPSTPGTPSGPGPVTTVVSGGGGINCGTLSTPCFVVQITIAPTASPTRGTGTPGKNGMPGTGLFDTASGGKADPNSLAMVGFATLGLVGVIVVSRKLRMK